MPPIAPRLRDVELRHLRYFAAVAEELHFGRAARRLHLSQPALSVAIRQLERLVRCALVDRSDRRRVRLTEAGEALLAHVRELDALVLGALEDVHQLARRGALRLRVGYNDGEPIAQRPARLREAMLGAQLTVAFRRLAWGTEATLLRRGELDALLARLPIDLAGLSHDVVWREPLRLCLSASHPLARRRALRMRDLAGVAVVVPVGGSAEWQDFWRGAPNRLGVRVGEGPEVHSPEETFDVVASGAGACFIPASMITGAPGLRTVVVRDAPQSELAVVWRGSQRAPVRALVAAVRALASATSSRRGAEP